MSDRQALRDAAADAVAPRSKALPFPSGSDTIGLDPAERKRRLRASSRRMGRPPVRAPGLHLPVERPDWFDDAACKGQTGLFFAPTGERPEKQTVREANACAICATCPVAEPCRQLGRAGMEFGVWGGETDLGRAQAGRSSSMVTRRDVLSVRRAREIR